MNCALIAFPEAPAGFVTFPVTRDDAAPHLKAGEFAVVDRKDREPEEGALFAMEVSRAPHAQDFRILHLVPSTLVEGTWLAVSVSTHEGLASSFGPLSPELAKDRIVGRVIGYLAAGRSL